MFAEFVSFKHLIASKRFSFNSKLHFQENKFILFSPFFVVPFFFAPFWAFENSPRIREVLTGIFWKIHARHEFPKLDNFEKLARKTEAVFLIPFQDSSSKSHKNNSKNFKSFFKIFVSL